MAERLHTTAACVATLFFSNNSKMVVQAGRKAAERVNPLFLGTGKSGDQRQLSSTPILGLTHPPGRSKRKLVLLVCKEGTIQPTSLLCQLCRPMVET